METMYKTFYKLPTSIENKIDDFIENRCTKIKCGIFSTLSHAENFTARKLAKKFHDRFKALFLKIFIVIGLNLYLKSSSNFKEYGEEGVFKIV